MKKIITAINNPKLNEELKKEKNFEIIGKDIQYKEAILEVLEKNKNINLIIISEKIPGEIKLEKLIEKIKLINEKIKIIFILEKENNELETILLKNKIMDIYYNNQINLMELIKIINKKEINMEEEIIKLKKIIEEKNNNLEDNKYFNKIKIRKNIKNKNEKKSEIGKSQINSKLTKIITISGNNKSGKSTLALIISQYLTEENKKVLLVDGDLEKQDLSIILKKEKYKNKKKEKNNKYKKSFFNKNNFIKNQLIKNKRKINKISNIQIKILNKKNKIYFYEIKNKINLFKINKNLFFLNGLNFLLKNIKQKNHKKVINIFFNIIKQKYNFIIIDVSKNNSSIINKKILEKGDMNFVVMEPDLLGLREIQKLLNVYLEEWKIKDKNINIILNKKNINSINKNLILKSLPNKNKIFEIKENKIIYIFMNNYFSKKFLLKNKKIKKEINKIIYKINN